MRKVMFAMYVYALASGKCWSETPLSSCSLESVEAATSRADAVFWISAPSTSENVDRRVVFLKGSIHESDNIKYKSKGECSELVFLDHSGHRFTPCAFWANEPLMPTAAIELSRHVIDYRECGEECTRTLEAAMRIQIGLDAPDGDGPYSSNERDELVSEALRLERKRFPDVQIGIDHSSYRNAPCMAATAAQLGALLSQISQTSSRDANASNPSGD